MIEKQDLTPREKETLELIRQRKKNREIAQMMDITEYTVNKYVSSIMGKMHVHKRMKAVEAYDTRSV